MNSEDLFDYILRLEDTHIQQGFEEGYEAGLVSDREDARHMGLKLGFETGELLDFYKGCSSLWNSPALLVHLSPPQLHKHLHDFQALLDKFPLLDPKDEIKDDLRAGDVEERNACLLQLARFTFLKHATRQPLKPLRELQSLFHQPQSSTSLKTLLMAGWLHSCLHPSSRGGVIIFSPEERCLRYRQELHCGSHPRLGVVDHICFHPLSQTSIDQVSAVATSLAMDIGSILKIPTYLYGAAHEEHCTLGSIRRKLGYFKANKEEHEWAGGLELEVLPVKPDAGPQEVSNANGVVAVGACGWVSNYNVPVMSTDLKAVRRMARKVSERGGGLASAQTMALVHVPGVIEVACNLLNPSQVGGDEVQGLIERLGSLPDHSTIQGHAHQKFISCLSCLC
ncbi:hypothetical protein N665_1321s0020 [Sinapis alba]|nr:hypothetical protein N665_1321s0020 [Sinapis alba]